MRGKKKPTLAYSSSQNEGYHVLENVHPVCGLGWFHVKIFSTTIVMGKLSYIPVEWTRKRKEKKLLSFVRCIITQKVSTFYIYTWRRHENQPCMNHCSHQIRQRRGELYALVNKSPLHWGKRTKAITRHQYITCIPSNKFIWKKQFKIIKMEKKIAKKLYKAM